MPSPYAPPEPSSSIWFEQTINAGIHLGSIAYGMHILVFFICAYYLLHEKGKKNWKWLAYITLLLTLGTLNIAFNMHLQEVEWIDQRNFPGGPLAHLFQEQTSPLNVAGNAAAAVTPFFTDGLLVYRVYVVWGKWYMAVIPGLALIAALIIGILFAVQTAQPNASLWSNGVLNFSLPFFSLSMALNIFLTLLLISRLLYMHHKIRSSLGSQYGKPYIGIAAMILESALPNALVSFVFVILYGIHNTAANLILPLQIQTTCISPMLIILRVVHGRAWSADTLSEVESRMRFDASYATTTVGVIRSGNGDGSTATFKPVQEIDSQLKLNPGYGHA